METWEYPGVEISPQNPAFLIKIIDFRSATEPSIILVHFVLTDKSFPHFFDVKVIPNYVEDTKCWLTFHPRLGPGELRHDLLNTHLCCLLSIVDVEKKSRFPEYFEVQKLNTRPQLTKDSKYLKKSCILEKEEEFLPDGVLTLRVDFIFDSRYIDCLNGDCHDAQYWSRGRYLFASSRHHIKNKGTTEPQRDNFTGDSSYELSVYDYTCQILYLPQFHEARRRFGVYGIPPEAGLFSLELEEINQDIFEHVWIFDIKDENQIFLHRFIVSFDEREDSVGTRLLRASPVLRRMVNAPMREQQEKRIELVNMSCNPTYFDTLTFLVHGTLATNHLVELIDLYKLSHLYEMEELQRKCAESMVENSKYESELEELERIAELYQDEYLQGLLEIRRNGYEILPEPLFRTNDRFNSDCYI